MPISLFTSSSSDIMVSNSGTIGTSVAAAILNRGGPAAWHVRQSVAGSPRGPLCGMGICFECRATVDGRPHERTCQLPVRDGMEVCTDA